MAHAERIAVLALTVLLTPALMAGCRPSQDPAPVTNAAASSPAPPAGVVTALPPGHPPLAQGALGGHGAPAGVGGLRWTKPADWKEETPSSGMRQAQYRVTGKGGEAECVVYYFGAGEGGDPQANAERWASQFSGPDGQPAVPTTRALKAGEVDVLMVEVHGTYLGGPTMGEAAAPQPRPDSMLLGAIANGPDANWFFKFTGPAATVRAQRAAFDGMVASLQKRP
jgi:hypothetical protein